LRLAACSPSLDVSRRGIAAVIEATPRDTIVLTLQQMPGEAATASSELEKSSLTP